MAKDIQVVYSRRLKELTQLFLEKIKDPQMPILDAYLDILGATQADVNVCYDKITRALPDTFFITEEEKISEEIREEIVKSFLLFMGQEDISKNTFDIDFSNYIYSTIHEVDSKFNLLN